MEAGLKLTSGTLKFGDVTTPEDAMRLEKYLRETVLPLSIFYITSVCGDERGTTIDFHRRSEI
jgi:hypothetical protein